jgi:acetylornithine/succinyldiaminopimelate/putrescine aminotransferase
MRTLSFSPVLGHITTFGGHPVSCAAGKAAFEILLQNNYIPAVKNKEEIFIKYLSHPLIKKMQHAGLWISLQFESVEIAQAIIRSCIDKGLITDWFLFAPDHLRIAPPLIITETEIQEACNIILSVADEEIKRS